MAVTHGLKNAFVIGSTGALGAVGARAAERDIVRVMPVTSHNDMTRMVGQDIALQKVLQAKQKGTNPT
jgi:hypothetical protein